ncbi:hypothetical protein H2201_008935 [Coniosporium apollinis]|uniref:DNA recombination and repair protein Rad51-like C-terminal domain-containing protein n=1 Tax=Coniosporium apollinis TaxID=61459 RepID=A0ABQ9NF26_9PEZI|nr:hypothetical protein H2201_008935 [Coniosporium apollinis]
MSAENLGRRLLGEVHEESLDELLHSLRAFHNADTQLQIGIPPLDRLLHAFQHPTITAQHQHVSDRSSSPSHHSPAQLRARKHESKPPIVELTSTTPGSGKTHLLYLTTIHAILPVTHASIMLHGFSSAVIILDTDNRFNIPRLADILKAHVVACQQAQQKPALEDQDLENLIQGCLKHVHVYRPQSTGSLLATLNAIPTYLFNAGAHHSSHRRLHSIILDSASAFYWPMRAEEELAKLGRQLHEPSDVDAPNAVLSTMTTPWTQLSRHLRRLQQMFDCAILFATVSLSPSPAPSLTPSSRRDIPSLRPALPGPMAHLATLRLVLARAAVPPFAPGMAVQDALGERGKRQEVVQRGRFWASVNGWDREAWGREVVDGLRRMGWGFGFRVMGEGVVLEGAEDPGAVL